MSKCDMKVIAALGAMLAFGTAVGIDKVNETLDPIFGKQAQEEQAQKFVTAILDAPLLQITPKSQPQNRPAVATSRP